VQLQELARTLRQLHSITHRQSPYAMEEDFARYTKAPLGRKTFQIRLLLKRLNALPKSYALCHHDLNPRNILFQGRTTVTLIDWEYARVNDRYFDLASVLVEFNLNKRDTLTFLRAYLPRKEKLNTKKLHLYEKAYRALCQLWFQTHDAPKGKPPQV
jgi:thiamine kinase-like enzyme